MPTLLQYPKFQTLDSNGDPLSGGLLYTYQAGTTTEKTTYSDRNMATPNANPVVLDSRGEAVVHFRGRLKCVLKDSDSTTIWTQDNIEGVDQGVNTRYPDTTETDQGAAGDGASVKDIIDDIGASLEATLVFKHDGTGNTTTYTFSTDETIPSNITVIVEQGVRLSIDSGVTLTIEGPLLAGAYQIFSGSGTATYTSAAGVHHNEWESGGSGVKIDSTLQLSSGVAIDGISNDTTLADSAADEAVTENAVKTYIDAKLPVGFPATWLAETPPTGWLERDGSTISRNTYADLFAVIGTKYGEGDGVSTFELPDDRGKFPRYWDHGAGVDPDAASRTGSDPLAGAGNVTGDHVGTNQADGFESHLHAGDTYFPLYDGVQLGSDGAAHGYGVANSSTSDNTSSTGGNETRPTNVYEMPIIKY